MLLSAAKTLITERYQAAHGAQVEGTYEHYEMIVGRGGHAEATMGYRFAGDEPLFLEAYLDNPIEHVLGLRLDAMIDRRRIVEIGDHASRSALATIALWRRAASRLEPHADFVVAVLTASLRSMFDRIGLNLIELAPARAACLPQTAENWGRYYESDPMICAGEIAAGRACFDRWADRAERAAR